MNISKQNILDCFDKITKTISRDNTSRYMKNHFEKEYNELLKLTSFLDKFDSEDKNKKVSIFERIYCLEHNLSDRPKCQNCKTEYVCGFNKLTNEYKKWCSPKCQSSDKNCINKSKETRLNKYGSSNYNGIEKSKITRYKNNNGKWHSDNFSIKTKESKLKHFGSENYANIDKIRETKLARYGSSNYNNIEKNLITRKSNFYNILCSDKNIIPLFTKEEYINGDKNTTFKWKCLKCGNVFESKFNYNFKCLVNKDYHVRCCNCFPYKEFSVSDSENEVYDFIKSIYNGTIIKNSRELIKPLEIDIVIPNKNLAIEFDGLYWHSTKENKDKNYHLMKSKLCQDKGFQLIHLFEDEWNNKKDIVKSRLSNLLGVYEKTIYARKCIIEEIPKDLSNCFLIENHIQGKCISSINLGLYFENELVSIMTFGKSRFSSKYEWELLRFCNKLNYHVIGGAGKLLKYFERNYNPKSLISYADRRWSVGNLYRKLGFNEEKPSNPNYWYLDSNFKERYSRIKFQKHKLKTILTNYNESLSEVQNMKNNGFNQIFDCGNLVFVKIY